MKNPAPKASGGPAAASGPAGAGEIRSPFLDLLILLRRGRLRIAVCAAIGAVALYGIGRLQPVGYSSETVLLTQPSMLAATAARVVNVPGSEIVNPLVASQIFEKFARSREVVEAALARLADEKGYDNVALLGLDDLADPEVSEERRTRALVENVRGRSLTFDYDQADPTIVLSVSSPGSAAHARDLAEAIVAAANERLAGIRAEQRAEAEADIAEARRRAEAELRRTEAELVAFREERRLATDPATVQRGLELERALEDTRELFAQLKSMEDKLAFADRRFVSPVVVIDGPSLPTGAKRAIPEKVAGAAGAFAGAAIGLLWIAYAAHLETMRRLNPRAYEEGAA